MRIIWEDPRPGLDEHGNEVTVTVRVSCTPEDAVLMARLSLRKAYSSSYIRFNDAQLIEHFRTVNYATMEEDRISKLEGELAEVRNARDALEQSLKLTHDHCTKLCSELEAEVAKWKDLCEWAEAIMLGEDEESWPQYAEKLTEKLHEKAK